MPVVINIHMLHQTAILLLQDRALTQQYLQRQMVYLMANRCRCLTNRWMVSRLTFFFFLIIDLCRAKSGSNRRARALRSWSLVARNLFFAPKPRLLCTQFVKQFNHDMTSTVGQNVCTNAEYKLMLLSVSLSSVITILWKPQNVVVFRCCNSLPNCVFASGGFRTKLACLIVVCLFILCMFVYSLK